jgi:hypothetical protein
MPRGGAIGGGSPSNNSLENKFRCDDRRVIPSLFFFFFERRVIPSL